MTRIRHKQRIPFEFHSTHSAVESCVDTRKPLVKSRLPASQRFSNIFYADTYQKHHRPYEGSETNRGKIRAESSS